MLRKLRWWIAGTGVALPVVLGLIAAFEPNRVIPGLLGGDAFHRLRPTRYWRERLRVAGRTGLVSDDLRSEFSFPQESDEVLLECLKDADPDIRKTAAFLMRRAGRIHKVVPGLQAALRDPDPNVKLQAIKALGERRANAVAAGDDLADLLQDQNLQIADEASIALWQVNPTLAVEKCGWTPFKSDSWGFSAMFPRQPMEKILDAPTPFGVVKTHSWTENQGVDHFTVAVVEHSQETVGAIPPDEWIRRLKENTGPFGLRVIREREIEQSGMRGWELLSESDGMGDLLTRHFWVGRRYYIAQVTYNPKFVNPGAVRFFLDSFRIEETAQLRK